MVAGEGGAKNIPSGQIQLGSGGAVSLLAGPDRALVGVQRAKPLKALKTLQSTLPEVVKKSTLVGHFFCVLHLKVTEKSLKFRTKSNNFQTNVDRLHSFIKVINFIKDCGNHFKMNYVVDDYTIPMFYLSFMYFLC